MEGIVKSGLEFFFPGSCFKTVVEDSNFGDGKLSGHYLANFFVSLCFTLVFSAQCLKMLYSRILSLTVLAGALIGKLWVC